MLYTGLTILAGLSILLLNYRQHDLFARRQSRLLLVGIMAATLPALFLSFIPQYFFNRPGIPFEWTFPTAVILPLTYIYAMRAGNLGQFDLFLNRSLVYGIVWLIGAGGYLLLYQVLSPVLSGGIILLILLILSDPLRRIASHQVDQLFYGGWYDYRTLVQTASAQLSRAQSLSELTEQLLYVARAMRFHEMVVIWWHGQDRDPLVTSQGLTLALDSDLLAQLPTLLANEHLKSIIVKDKILLVLPVLNRGIMLLGERRGEMALDESDHDILRTIREQASVAAAHITRLEEVAAIRDELIERQRRLTDTRESERLHLAQEIHDGPLQELYGLRFQLSTWETGTLPQTIDIRLQHISDTLRMICSELRPPVLAAFGLELALDAYLDPFRQQYPHVCFTLDLELDYALDERVQMMAFRVVQEGVNNALKHADPRYITIRARTREIADRLTLSLSIEDDGQGFPQPVAVHLRDAVRSGHLGLLGMTERVQAVGGTLVFHSAPGSGTSIQAEVELKKNG
jgi:signal transduction histidine kinase